jgi:TolB protein
LRRPSIVITLLLACLVVLSACQQPAPPDPTAALDGRGGGYIAFHSFRDGNSEIYVMNADGSGARRLTNHLAEDSCPSFAPDAKTIAFTSDRDGNSEVYRIGIDGQGLLRLTDTVSVEMHPVWTPDGARLVFARDGDIWVMDADGTDQAQLTRGLRAELPFVTPDGGTIVFSDSSAGNYDVRSVPVEGGQVTTILGGASIDVFATPSPDGKSIALMRGGRNLHIATIDGASSQNIRSNAENPAWAPDGTSLAFHSEASGNYEIYRMDRDGKNAINLTRSPGNDFWPTWVKAH